MQISARKMKIWWSKLKSPTPSKRGKTRKVEEEDSSPKKVSVSQEYNKVFRTESYVDIWSKVQVQLKGSTTKTTLDHKLSPPPPPPPPPPSSSNNKNSNNENNNNNNNDNILPTSSSLPLYMHLSDSLLEPRQDDVIDIIKSSKLKTLLIDYFDASLDFCNICESLLSAIHKTRSNHRLIKRVFKGDQCHEMIIQDLDSFARLNNPLSIIDGAVNFPDIHEKYTLLLQKLTSRRRKIKRWGKFTKFYKNAATYCFVITYGVLAVALITLAMHSMVGLLGAPGLLMSFSLKKIKKLSSGGLRVSFLERLGSQLDEAARGVYTLINDFDTVGRLVTRLHDEVEHRRTLAEMCVRNRKSHEVVKEALKELEMHENGFVEKLKELEEHIYLCFLTINRSRRLVIQEISAP